EIAPLPGEAANAFEGAQESVRGQVFSERPVTHPEVDESEYRVHVTVIDEPERLGIAGLRAFDQGPHLGRRVVRSRAAGPDACRRAGPAPDPARLSRPGRTAPPRSLLTVVRPGPPTPLPARSATRRSPRGPAAPAAPSLRPRRGWSGSAGRVAPGERHCGCCW